MGLRGLRRLEAGRRAERVGRQLPSLHQHFLETNCTSSTATTVDDCLSGVNGTQDPATVDKYKYGGGHMQKHASLLGLGGLDNAALTAEVRSKLGNDFAFSYTAPQLAGGIQTTAGDYAVFLRKLLVGAASPLLIAGMLGDDAVCTNPSTCPTAISNRIDDGTTNESWGYGLGHWIESDPSVGDGSFSSAGAFGFYPWVDQSRTHYGVLARMVATQHAGYISAECGRLIRKAWVTGIAQ